MKMNVWIAATGLLLGIGCSASTPEFRDDEDGPASAAAPSLPGPEGERAFRELEEYYRDPSKAPATGKALEELNSADPKRRRSAGRYLHALLAQLFADESNSRGVWTASGFWGGGSESPTRAFRVALAKALADGPAREEALDAAAWLLTTEKAAQNQKAGMILLQRIAGVRSDALLAAAIREPHPNGEILSGALGEAARRKLTSVAPDVRILADHHRSAVREAARKAAAALGITDLPEFDPKRAFTPSFERRVRAFADLILPEIPERAEWVRVRVTLPSHRPGGEARVEEFSGWKLGEPDGKRRLLDAYGREREAPIETSQVTTSSLREEADALLKRREAQEKGDRDQGRRLSRGGSLTGQFEPSFISAPEALVAAWSLQRNDRDTAARLLLSRFDAAADDRWISWAVRDLLGHLYHVRMLDAFSYERDYAGALALASHLSKSCFDDYQYQPRAKELARQLPRRTADFRTLTLPSAEEWNAIRKPLGRTEQVRYLAERLRLLNCFQWGQPGDVKYGDPQLPKPMTTYREQENRNRLPSVINPYLELRALKLSVAELPILVPYLADGDFMPTYSFWRSFHPSRTLHRVSWAVDVIVNDAAFRDLAERETYGRLDPAGRKAHLERILSWCRNHAATPRNDLLLEALKTASQWPELEHRAAEAFESRIPGALEILSGRMRDFSDHQADFAELCAVTRVPNALTLARSWMKDSSKEVRFFGALILLRGAEADRNVGLEALDRLFAHEGLELHAYAVDDLLALRVPEADRLALLACRKFDPFHDAYSHPSEVLRRLFLRGLKPCRDYILAELQSERKDRFGTTDAEQMAGLLYSWKDDFNIPIQDTPESRRGVIVFMIRWINEQFDRIQRGENPDLKTDLPPIVRGRWRIDAP